MNLQRKMKKKLLAFEAKLMSNQIQMKWKHRLKIQRHRRRSLQKRTVRHNDLKPQTHQLIRDLHRVNLMHQDQRVVMKERFGNQLWSNQVEHSLKMSLRTLQFWLSNYTKRSFQRLLKNLSLWWSRLHCIDQMLPSHNNWLKRKN